MMMMMVQAKIMVLKEAKMKQYKGKKNLQLDTHNNKINNRWQQKVNSLL